ncbi:hypothetical protein QTG54_004607 [Skeletonema marinoi]|uniref:Sulfotransferase domain-containing protein n=1 Tax=Skeletonema marinoi TaxID=267567 RepID=A0AAD9DF40_9STRA|nr:hypothetical protein QTG54_004607 [Skeletonema marinoi]
MAELILLFQRIRWITTFVFVSTVGSSSVPAGWKRFYFVSFSHRRFENTMLQNTSHTSQQWWLNQTIDPNCSCETPWDSSVAPTDRMECCHRSVGRKEEYDLLTNLTYQLEQDYRTVFVTRNWYDTIISGYLYHQSGRECWLSSGGKGGASGWLKNFIGKTPPADGLRVYADFAIGFWLHSVSALATARNSIPPAKLRTLFLCYDQFNENEKFPDAIKEAGHFLYPADDSTQWDGLKSDNHGGGGHSTTADKVFRMGLHDMLRIIDSEHFDGEIREGNSKFGCKSEAESSLLTEAE